jgi:endonuclease G
VADERALLKESFQSILSRDKDLVDKLDLLKGLANSPELRPRLESVRERVGTLESIGPDSALSLETIVNRVGRPVLEVADDDYEIDGPEALVWEEKLSNATVRSNLQRVIPSVGRIEVENHPDLPWVGTGWLIAEDIVVTNRHVAREFAIASGNAFVFKRGWPDRRTPMTARIDFRRELRSAARRPFAVREVLHIEDDDGPDFAFLKVERTGPAGDLSAFLHPVQEKPQANQYLATIGYPAADSRLPEQELMNRLFGDKYNVKRLAPGQIMRLDEELVLHDCSTLGGNSGSPIVDLATGAVLGLHFSGVFLRENRGVPIGYVVSRLEKRKQRPQPPDGQEGERKVAGPAPVADRRPAQEEPAGDAVTWTIPLQIRVSLGTPAGGGPPAMLTVATGEPPPPAETGPNQGDHRGRRAGADRQP